GRQHGTAQADTQQCQKDGSNQGHPASAMVVFHGRVGCQNRGAHVEVLFRALSSRLASARCDFTVFWTSATNFLSSGSFRSPLEAFSFSSTSWWAATWA